MSTGKKRNAQAADLEEDNDHDVKHDGSNAEADSNESVSNENIDSESNAEPGMSGENSSYNSEAEELFAPVIFRGEKMFGALQFKVMSSDTIGQLKQQIRDELGFPVDQIEFTCKAGMRTFDDDRKISSLCGSPVYFKRLGKRFQISIKTLTGTTITLNVNESDTILSVMCKIQSIEGTPWDQQRLMFEGEHLYAGRTLVESRITPGSILVLTLQLRGMISTFTSTDDEDPLTQYLLLSDEERALVHVPIEELRQKEIEEGASFNSSFSFEKEHSILDATEIQLLNRFLDFLWLESSQSANQTDLRARVSDDCFVALMAPLDDEDSKSKSILKNLKAQSKATGPSVALRMTTGPTNACINFHCDGGYATYTTQIALNDPSEYDGGRLCFFTNDQLHVLERPAGSIVEHHCKVLHGVTALTRGTRKSLFMVDETNGLGEGNVVQVKMAQVERFLEKN